MSRKDKPIGQVFDRGFSWTEALDAVADTYNGVSDAPPRKELLAHLTRF